MENTQQKPETDDLDTLLAEAWPQLNRETQRRWVMYATRLTMSRGRRGADTERGIDELTTRILARAEKSKVLHGLSRSLKEMAAGDVRPIDDVIREAKLERSSTSRLSRFELPIRRSTKAKAVASG